MRAMTDMASIPQGVPFLKMHGLGNDFVIIDARKAPNPVTPALARAVGHRHFGVGYDQLAVLTESSDADVDVTYWNADGTTAGACGNASRCIARLMMEETGSDAVVLRTERGLLPARIVDGAVSVRETSRSICPAASARKSAAALQFAGRAGLGPSVSRSLMNRRWSSCVRRELRSAARVTTRSALP